MFCFWLCLCSVLLLNPLSSFLSFSLRLSLSKISGFRFYPFHKPLFFDSRFVFFPNRSTPITFSISLLFPSNQFFISSILIIFLLLSLFLGIFSQDLHFFSALIVLKNFRFLLNCNSALSSLFRNLIVFNLGLFQFVCYCFFLNLCFLGLIFMVGFVLNNFGDELN